jgi:ABC-type transport system involved in cytochrome bd biosynthesis fused ATPase/permease subunit
MRSSGWLGFVHRVSRRGDSPRRACIAVVACGERLLAPVLVHVATFAGIAQALAVGVVLSAILALRGLIQNAHLARTEAGLYLRVVDSVLRQDVLQPSVLPDEEARAVLFEGAHDMARLLAEGLPNLCANVVAGAIFAVVVAVTQPARIVVVAVLSGSVGALFLVASRRMVEVAQRAATYAWVNLADGVSNAFDGRLEIVAGGRADDFVGAFGQIASSWGSATVREARVARLAGRLPLLLLAAAIGGAIALDGVLRGEVAGRTLSQAALLAAMAPAFVGIVHGLQEMARSDRRLRPMLDLMAVVPSASSRQTPLPTEIRSVELRGVHFEYERSGRRHEALHGVSLTWRAGELLLLAGPNGSGKSTCLRALLGLGRRTGGEVFIEGVPLDRIDIEQWRRRVAFLPQRPYLPPRATVRDSLRFVDSDVTNVVMFEALERVGLGDLRSRDAQSPLDVRVDELSVGQRQRVGLARVLCRRSPMVVLDEPDANLDSAGVELVTALVSELARERMVIVAAHSAQLLAVAARVVTLDAGRLGSESTRQSA